MSIERTLTLPPAGTETFFLWGPRQTGKSTLLKEHYPNAIWVDLLKTDEYRRYLGNPELLRQELASQGKDCFIVIDEIQKLPSLLNEVHWLHENMNCHFGLCGSSARKVKRGHANLLGGRAVRYELQGLVSSELKETFNLVRLLNHGYLPRMYLSDEPRRLLNAYVSDYLKEEIAAEGLVRNLPAFSEFLSLSSLSDTEAVNFSTIARECGVSSPTVKEYFQILVDTLIGKWLPSYRKRPKRRVATSPKFYFFDIGIVNFLAQSGTIEEGSELFGKAFENWCFHELDTYNSYSESFAKLSYWRLTSGIEVDFIINDMETAIEVKGSKNIAEKHLKGLRHLKAEHPQLQKRILVCLENKQRITEDRIEILPAEQFAHKLWQGEVF